ncbi:uncharacterized protein LOC133913417 [Phragmites australis]|uniref:uncharacterized protein LOC133913417 n=1 Tax=Phragmites australis TaxID=29695 RepID=UPI002D798053|nr:uncharacterized protein LOC133913417 [Phragmites australis]
MVTMLRLPSSRNHGSKKLRPRHSFQVFLLVAAGVWIVYQLTHSYSKRRAVVMETDDNNGMDGGEPARRSLGRKGFVDFAGHASDDDTVGIRGGSDAGSEGFERGGATSDNPLSKAEKDHEGDGSDMDDEQADEYDGVDDTDDELAADEGEDDRGFQSQNGNDADELKTVHGDTPNGSNRSIASSVNATDRMQDSVVVVQLANATDGSANGSATPLKDSALKNASPLYESLRDKGRPSDLAREVVLIDLAVGAPGAENKKLTNNSSADEDRTMINQNGTADSVTGHGISK